MRDWRTLAARTMLLAAALAVVAGLGAAPRAALADGPPPPLFTECPAVGQDTGCALLVVVNADGSTSVQVDPNQPPFDGQSATPDDVLVGVLNQGPTTLTRLPLTSSGTPAIFHLDGDGLCSAQTSPRPSGCPFGPTGYEGPQTTFTITDVNDGFVNFALGLGSGGSAYFSLGGPVLSSIVLDPRYVALGDSYSSGEGVPPFFAGTDTAQDPCHRSQKAYPELIRSRTGVPANVEFWACSGRTIRDFFHPMRDGNEGPQLDHLAGPGATLVTVSVGGNDIDFGQIGLLCTSVPVARFFERNKDFKEKGCGPFLNDSTDALITGLITGNRDAQDNATYSLPELYRAIRARAPFARVFVVGYPRIIPLAPDTDCVRPIHREDGSEATEGWGGFLHLIYKLPKDNLIWINKVISRLNSRIETAALDAGFFFVDTQDAFAFHHVCAPDPWVNGLVLDNTDNPSVFTFHPNATGQAVLADRVAAEIANPFFLDVPFQGVAEQRVSVAQDQERFAARSSWPGSDVKMTLVSPSGVVYDRTTQSANVIHQLEGNGESFSVVRPEPGQWTVRLFGASVGVTGEHVRLDTTQVPLAAGAPVAMIDASAFRGVAPKTIDFDGGRSAGVAGAIASYRWDFGDGTPPVDGRTASHAFPAAGTHTVSLTVTDADGRQDTATKDISLTATDQPPTASFQWWLTGPSKPTETHFDATQSDDVDGSIVSYSWDFGDGSTGTGVAQTHTYTQPGSYPATLTVTDDGGLQASVCQLVTPGTPSGSPSQSCPPPPGLPRAGGTSGLGAAAGEGWAALPLPFALTVFVFAGLGRRRPRRA